MLCDLSVYWFTAGAGTPCWSRCELQLWRTVQSVYIGLFANEVLPLRVGELIRCYLLAHWNGLNLSVDSLPPRWSVLIDGFWMLAAFLITAVFVKGIPPDLTIWWLCSWPAAGGGHGGLDWIVMHKQHAHTVIRESRWAAACGMWWKVCT